MKEEQKEKFGLSDVLFIALRIEKNGYAFYADLANSTLKQKLKDVFSYLTKEESKHVDLFKELCKYYRGYFLEPSSAVGFNMTHLDKIGNEHIFVRNTFEEVKRKIAMPVDAINQALVFEEESIKFFEELKEAVRDSHLEIMRALIKEEEYHKTKLQMLLLEIDGAR